MQRLVARLGYLTVYFAHDFEALVLGALLVFISDGLLLVLELVDVRLSKLFVNRLAIGGVLQILAQTYFLRT